MAKLRLLLIILLSLILIPIKGPDTSITFIDVGQGDGICIDAGEDILIDCGSSSTKKIGKYTLEPFLKSRRIGSIEKLFVTHADSDHTNGLTYLGESTGITVDDLYLPACAEGDAHYDELINAICGSSNSAASGSVVGGKTSDIDNSNVDDSVADNCGVHTHIHYISSGDVIPLERGTITCMSPQSAEPPEDMNDQSLVLLYRENDFSALFTGDASQECEQEMLDAIEGGSIPKVNGLTLLKVGHHGSKTSTSEALIDATEPLIAILSYGEGNRYGHPHQETTELLDRYHVRTLHTADSGAITLTTDGNSSIHISQFCDSN